jgi:DNA-binding ferritin-like protein (Dps family)
MVGVCVGEFMACNCDKQLFGGREVWMDKYRETVNERWRKPDCHARLEQRAV